MITIRFYPWDTCEYLNPTKMVDGRFTCRHSDRASQICYPKDDPSEEIACPMLRKKPKRDSAPTIMFPGDIWCSGMPGEFPRVFIRNFEKTRGMSDYEYNSLRGVWEHAVTRAIHRARQNMRGI